LTVPPDNQPVELGVKFRSDISGYVAGVRFYKSVSNTGAHIGHLWDASGALLATAKFVNETSFGWQQVAFSPPVRITAGKTYVVSYHTDTGHYASDNGYFTSTGVDNGPLHALKDVAGAGNGVFAYGAGNTFPDQSFKGSNYWVDVVFTKAQTLWPSTAWPLNASSAEAVPVELGVKFRSDKSGYVGGVRFYKSAANTGEHLAHLWDANGTLLGTTKFVNETASGWQEVAFPTPIPVVEGTTYVVSTIPMLGTMQGTAAISPPPG